MATNLTLTFHGETELLILARCCYLIRLLKHQYHGSRKKYYLQIVLRLKRDHLGKHCRRSVKTIELKKFSIISKI